MAVEFRCDKCGRRLRVDAEIGSALRCPHCRAKVTVPTALASLPEPKVPTRPAGPVEPVAASPEDEDVPAEQAHHDTAMKVLNYVMPWVISLFFHVGILVLLAFVVMFITETTAEDIIIPDARLSDMPGGQLNPGADDPDLDPQQDVTETTSQQFSKAEADMKMAEVDEKDITEIIGIGGGGSAGGDLARFGLYTGGEGAGPRSRFFGTGGNAHHIVYVVDRSGSMQDTLDVVRVEMSRSIGDLVEGQDFHVIFFSTGKPVEFRPRRLVPATNQQKRQAGAFLDGIMAQGQTNPLPAMARAFAVLRRSSRKKGKLIYLLTDGEFPDNKEVLKRLAEWNKDKTVHVNTILHHHRPPEAERVLKQIAKENGGTYRYVALDE